MSPRERAKEFMRRRKNFLSRAFFPDDVTPDYYSFTAWRFAQRYCSATMGVFRTSSLLFALCIRSGRICQAAVVSWVLKEGLLERGKLPPVLFIQADNCTRENKNRYLLSYLELLVRNGVFEEVHLCFLPIGHTHADIDQSFPSVSTRLRLEPAVTDIDLLNLLRNCYNPRAYAEPIEEIANFSGLCDFTKCTRNVTGFTPFCFFRTTRKVCISDVTEHEGDQFVTTCDVKVQCIDQWAPLDNSSERAGSLKFTPDLSATPITDTDPPSNVLEVNKHLGDVCKIGVRSCEQRVTSPE